MVKHIRNADTPWLRAWRFGYVVTDAVKWDVDPERYASEFDAG
jgi:hypothetical protein